MHDPAAYLTEVEMAFISSPVVVEYQIVRAWANTDDGYIRLRATLTNSDFLEAAEYFVLEEDQIVTVDYRYQWMDDAKQSLRKRWDNTPDHPGLNGSPHHVHIDREENVTPGQPLNLLELLTILENELL